MTITTGNQDGSVSCSVSQVPNGTREERFREQVLSELEVVYRVARRLTRMHRARRKVRAALERAGFTKEER